MLAVAAPCSAAGDPARFDDIIRSVERSERVIFNAESAAPVIEELVEYLPPDDLERRARLDGLKCSWSFPEQPDECLAFAEARLAVYEEAEHFAGIARMLRCRAILKAESGAFAEGLADLHAAVAAASTADDSLLLAEVLRSRGDARSFHGDFGQALDDLLAAYRLLEAAGEPGLAAQLDFDIGAVYRRLGAYDEAVPYLMREIDAAEATGNARRAAMAHLQLGFAYLDQGHGEKAEIHFLRGVERARITGSEVLVGDSLLALGLSLNLQGEHERALAVLFDAKASHDRVGYALNHVMTQLQRGVALAGLGRHREAVAEFETVEPALVERDQQRYLALLYPARAESLEATGRLAEALADWRAYNQVRDRLDQRSQRHRADLLRVQFDVSRREIETERLRTETLLQEERFIAMSRTRTWQTLALVLGAVLGMVLVLALLALVARARRLQVMAMTDQLTGVANRRRVELYLADQLRLHRRHARPLSVISLDIDHFKQVNDSCGHPAGDVVLQRVVRAGQESLLRAGDLIGRTGGEEFLMVLPGTPMEAARMVAQRLRAAVEAMDTSDVIGQSNVTISLGVAMARAGDSVKDLQARVDDALYRAKQGGRNRVEVQGA